MGERQFYVLDQADDIAPHGRVLLVNPRTHAVSTVADGFAFPNGIAEDAHGFLYIADSLQGPSTGSHRAAGR